MKIEFSYNLASLHAAAQYIWENNPSVTKWHNRPQDVFDIKEIIHADIVRFSTKNANLILKERRTKVSLPDEWCTYTGTGGYYLLFDLQSEETAEDISIGVDILVNPSVGSPVPRYVTEVIDTLVLDV